MGAIVAIIGEAGDPELPERLEKMLARSPYRGGPKRHFEDGFAIAVQTCGWDASLATVGNWTVAMHGVIGNWPELAPIHGWDFPENATNATKLAIAYEDLGDRLFGQLRGEFAILIHNRHDRNLIAIRDLWGSRPLFFERTTSRTYIASEIRQVRAGSRTPNEIDGDVLIQAILWNPTYPERTHVKGIRRVQANRTNTFPQSSMGAPSLGPEIWAPPPPSNDHHYDFDELTEELRFLIHQSINRWMIDVPFTLSMSGGVDSSTLWWAISERARTGDPRAATVQVFSYRYPGHQIDESDQISRILAKTNCRNHAYIDYPSTDATRFLFENAKHMDSPYGGAFLAPTTVPGTPDDPAIRLALYGIGGDSLFGMRGGNLADLFRQGRFATFFHDLWTLEPPGPQGRLAFVASKTIAPAWRRIARRLSPSSALPEPSWIHRSRLATIEAHASQTALPPGQAEISSHRRKILKEIEVTQSLAGNEAAQQLSASQNFEGGFPLMDIDLVDFALRIPSRAFSNGQRYKQLLRNVAYDHFGEAVRGWKNPYPAFILRPFERESLRQALPPAEWVLADLEIVDRRALTSLFSTSATDRSASSTLTNLAAAEAVVRSLT